MEGKEKIMSIEKRLHETSFSGNVDHLHQLMAEDRLSLARSSTISFNETPLHVAAMLGHLDFAQALVVYRPELAGEVDCRGSTPLHLASANGYVEIVKVLLQVNSDACLVRDEEGRTPLCLAVMKGRIEVAEELIRVKPEVTKCNLNATGETLLHLAVKYNRFDCLKMLVERVRESQDVLNRKDDNGNTVLHLAACLKQTETIKYLVRAKVSMDAVNANGFTASDIVENMPRDLKTMEIRETLTTGSRTSKVPRPGRAISNVSENRSGSDTRSRNVNDKDWADKKFAGITVAATVVASMAYQAVFNPPGGIWDSDSKQDDQRSFKAGTSILATTDSGLSQIFWVCNTISFMSSFSILFFLVGGFALKRRFLVRVLVVSMWITITSMAVSYAVSMSALQPERETAGGQKSKSDSGKVPALGAVSAVLFAWLLSLFIFRFSTMLRRKLRQRRLSRRENTSTVNENV